MNVLVSIDPGLRECGMAVFRDGILKAAHFVREDYGSDAAQIRKTAGALVKKAIAAEATEVVIETMVFRSTRTDAAQDILSVQGVVGAVCALLGEVPVTFAVPSVWTSNRPKAQNHTRIWARLSEMEAYALHFGLTRCPKTNHKELLDAVGIGLFHLRRL